MKNAWDLSLGERGPDPMDTVSLDNLHESTGAAKSARLDMFTPDGGGMSSFINVPIPGGNGEKPKEEYKDGYTNPSVPSGSHDNQPAGINPKASSTTITADAYNQIIKTFQGSYKEMGEILEFLGNVTIINESTEEVQDNYTDLMVEQAILESYISGPIFEAVNRTDKAGVKDVLDAIWGKMKDEPNDKYRLVMFKPSGVGGFLTDIFVKPGWKAMRNNSAFKVKSWQMCGIFFVKSGEDASSALTYYNGKFKEELGTYVFNLMDVSDYTIGRVENEVCYILIVDNSKAGVEKLSATAEEKKEMKAAAGTKGTGFLGKFGKKKDTEGKEDDKSDKKDDKKGGAKTEAADDLSDMPI